MSRPSLPSAASAAPSSLPPHALQAASEPALARVIDRARWLDALDAALRQRLPATLAGQAKLANVDDAHLVFLVPNPVWKTKLRQSSHLLEAAAAEFGLPARRVLVKIAAEPFAARPEQERRTSLSAEARASLRATAQSVADPDLRAQLLRLASLA